VQGDLRLNGQDSVGHREPRATPSVPRIAGSTGSQRRGTGLDRRRPPLERRKWPCRLYLRGQKKQRTNHPL